MSYLELVKADVEQWIEDNQEYINYADFSGKDDFYEYLDDALFCEDSVTGNASGSYTFNSYEAREIVLENMDEVQEALQEFCVSAEEIGERFLNEDWEYFDVTARCYVLGSAIWEYIEEHEEEIEQTIENAA